MKYWLWVLIFTSVKTYMLKCSSNSNNTSWIRTCIEAFYFHLESFYVHSYTSLWVALEIIIPFQHCLIFDGVSSLLLKSTWKRCDTFCPTKTPPPVTIIMKDIWWLMLETACVPSQDLLRRSWPCPLLMKLNK